MFCDPAPRAYLLDHSSDKKHTDSLFTSKIPFILFEYIASVV